MLTFLGIRKHFCNIGSSKTKVTYPSFRLLYSVFRVCCTQVHGQTREGLSEWAMQPRQGRAFFNKENLLPSVFSADHMNQKKNLNNFWKSIGQRIVPAETFPNARDYQKLFRDEYRRINRYIHPWWQLKNKTEKSFSLIGCAKSDKPYNSSAWQQLSNTAKQHW